MGTTRAFRRRHLCARGAGPLTTPLTAPEFAAFLDGARNGEFDHLV